MVLQAAERRARSERARTVGWTGAEADLGGANGVWPVVTRVILAMAGTESG